MSDRRVPLGLLAAAMFAVTWTTAIAQPRVRWTLSADNVPGWVLMTPTERTEHTKRMQAIKTYDECRAYMTEHRARLEARAREQGKTLRAARFDVCDQMKANGYLE